MEPWQIIVALIQGLVEWLPISSEGQAVLFVYNFGDVSVESLITLVAWLHLGTALAVIVRYPNTIFEIISLKDRNLFRQLLLATGATAITALPMYFLLREGLLFFNGEIVNVLVGVFLLVTAILLYLPTRNVTVLEIPDEVVEPDDKISTITGLAQGFSILPGLSRSGTTISVLLMQKVNKETALRFSFLMSVPAVLGIFTIELLLGGAVLPTIAPIDLLLMEIIVFFTGLLSMEILLRIAQRISFWKFCLVLGVVAILFGTPAFL